MAILAARSGEVSIVEEFFARLKEHKLVQWLLGYAAVAVALIPVLDIVAAQFGWPESLRRGITLAVIMGFFMVLVLAWYHGERGAQKSPRMRRHASHDSIDTDSRPQALARHPDSFSKRGSS